MPALRVDAQFTVIESTLKGYTKWKRYNQSQPTADLELSLESWCEKLLTMKFEVRFYRHQLATPTLIISQDPAIRKRILQLAVCFSTTALKKNAGFILKVLEFILMTWPTTEPEYRAFNEGIKDLQSESMVELQRLASEMPDHLLVSTSAVFCIHG